jgi:hypothetical protein
LTPPQHTFFTGLSFLAMAIGGLRVLVFVVMFVYGALGRVGIPLWRRIFAVEPQIVCPRCGVASRQSVYEDGKGCPN